MASGRPGDTVRLIGRLFRDGTVGALTDGQLPERFAARRGEAAEAGFEAPVSRHGPTVLRVDRGMLRDPHDADDAFQATFLVLVRKAGSIGERELLGPWLHGVAHRVALKARAVAAKHSRREGEIADDPPADVAEGAWLDLRPVLHEELNRLPEKYLSDESLSLLGYNRDGPPGARPPLENNRVFVDDSIHPPRVRDGDRQPAPGTEGGRDVKTGARLDEIETKLDCALKELEDLRGGRRPAEPAGPPSARPSDSPSPPPVSTPTPGGSGEEE